MVALHSLEMVAAVGRKAGTGLAGALVSDHRMVVGLHMAPAVLEVDHTDLVVGSHMHLLVVVEGQVAEAGCSNHLGVVVL